MTPSEYNKTQEEYRSISSEAIHYFRLKTLKPDFAATTHITWEGFGPIFGKRTKLLSVHHAILPEDQWSHRRESSLKKKVAYATVRHFYRMLGSVGTPLLVPSKQTRDDLVYQYNVPESLIHVLPNGLDTDFFTPGDRTEARRVLDIPQESFVVLRLSNDDGRKNTNCVVNVWRAMQRQDPSTMLVQLGPSPQLSEMLARGGLGGVRLLNDIPAEQLRALYRASDVIFHPSLTEGFSYAVLQAMSCGVPVVTSNLPVFEDELGPYYDGLSPYDAAGFFQQLERIRASRRDGPILSLREHVQDHFSLDQFGQGLLKVYSEVGLTLE
ncbi:MAG: glycosyltransferase family 4 protein [Nitrososphaerota archaeon]|nr:glycosyltransferase family 4 protein [Nitrososphaerota archaeon]